MTLRLNTIPAAHSAAAVLRNLPVPTPSGTGPEASDRLLPAPKPVASTPAPGATPHAPGAERAKLTARLQNVWRRVSTESSATVSALGATIEIRAEPILWTSSGATDSRRSHASSARARGAATVWVATGGTLHADRDVGASRSTHGRELFVGWKSDTASRYRFELPVEYKSDRRVNDAALHKELAEMRALPFSIEAARSLPPGALLSLEGRGFFGTDERRAKGRRSDDAEHAAEVRVQRMTGDRVRVSLLHRRIDYERPLDYETYIPRIEVSPNLGPAELEVGFELGKLTHESFVLDLSKPAARAAYTKLLTLDVDAARSSAENSDSGVIRDREPQRRGDLYDLGLRLFGNLAEVVGGGTNLGAGLHVWQERVAADSPIVRNDPTRSQMEAAAEERGESLRWLRSGGVVEPRLSAFVGVGEIGTVTASVGAQAGGVLRYNVLSSHVEGATASAMASAKRAINLAIMDPAKLADDAIPPGTEITYQGVGVLRGVARAGTGYNRDLGFGFELAATAGGEVSTEVMREHALVLKKLDDGTISVAVRRMTQSGDRASVRGKAGFDFNSVEALREYDGESVVADWLDGKVGNKLKRLIERPIEKFLTFEAHAATSSTVQNDHAQRFGPFDPKNPQHMKALQALVSLRSSDDAAAMGSRFVDYVEGSRATRTDTTISMFSKRMLLNEVLRRDRTGHLLTDGGEMRFRTRELTKHRAVFRELRSFWESVAYETDLLPERKATFLHLSLTNDDPFTSSEEVRDFRTLAGELGAGMLAEPRAENAAWYRRIFSRHGESKQNVDIWITDDGLLAAGRASREQALNEFARASAAFDPMASEVPWLVAGDRARLQGMYERWTELNKQTEDRPEKNDLAYDYKQETGRPIGLDARLYEQAVAFADLVGKMNGAQSADVSELVDNLAALGERIIDGPEGTSESLRFMWRSLAALSHMAGADEVMVHRLSMTGRRVEIRARTEERLVHPNDLVSENLGRER